MVHVPINYFPVSEKLNVLIIGGGDGGAIRELLKHENIENITIVEIDHVVVDVCLKHFPSLSAVCLILFFVLLIFPKGFASPKVTTIFEEGAGWVEEQVKIGSPLRFDVILIDSTDIGPALPLQRDNFYLNCKKLLKSEKNGIVIKNFESPSIALQTTALWSRHWGNIFGYNKLYSIHMPSYAVGYYCFAFLSDGVDPVLHKVTTPLQYLSNFLTYFFID